jgi:hypothetical protein
MERFGVDPAQDVAKVEVAIEDFFDLLAADVAAVAFFAFGHWVGKE